MQKPSPETTVEWQIEEDPDSLSIDSVIAPFHADDSDHNYAIRDLLAASFPDYCLSHQVPEFKLKTVNAMISCKTGKLGYSLIHCKQCGKIEMRSCSCGNRNCPSCGYLEEKRWTAMRQAEVIPGIPYFHLVFTLPHALTDIMYQNQKETLNLLFSAAKDTILTLSMKKLKMTPGILLILHSFGSNLSLHYHLHVLVSGGGLTKDKTRFKSCLSNGFFLPLKAVTKVYRGKFMDGLKKLHDSEKLQYYHDAQKYRNSYEWKELLNTCYHTAWNVEIKPLAPVKKMVMMPVIKKPLTMP
jgi:Putative transposase.